MQYNGYEIQITESGCIIRDGQGNYIMSTENDTEAKECIDDLENNVVDIEKLPTDWYSRFEQYCKNLPGKCYPTSNPRKFGTTSSRILSQFVKSFEELNHVTIKIVSEIIDGEKFYIVEEVY